MDIVMAYTFWVKFGDVEQEQRYSFLKRSSDSLRFK